jgi:hypothetical protein
MNKIRKHQPVLNALINIGKRTRGLSFSLFIVFFMVAASPANAAALTYSNDTNILLSTPGITLVILAGSVADGLVVNAGSVVVTLSAGEILTLTSPQSLTSVAGGGVGAVTPNCVSAIETNTITQQSGTGTYTLTPTGSACVQPASGGGGGGGPVIVYTPAIAIHSPGSAAVYNAGSIVGFDWIPSNGAFTKYRISYSVDNGINWLVVLDGATSTNLSWVVPNASTTQGKIKVEGYNSSGGLLASVISTGNFTINGTVPATSPTITNPATNPTTAPLSTDPTATGTYSPSVALANTPDIATDKGLTAPSANTTIYCTADSLIKGSLPAVYYCGVDGKRYVFVNSRVYFTWYGDFSMVKVISDADLAKIPLGGNVTYRPGVKMVKAESDPKVYVVSRGGLLRWISSETIAKQLYGNNWNKMIDYIPDAFWINYQFGDPIN